MRRFLAFAATAVVFGAGGFFASRWLDHRSGTTAKTVTLHGYVYWKANIIQFPDTTDCDTSAVYRGNQPGPQIYAPDGTLLTATKIATGPVSVQNRTCFLPWSVDNVTSEPVYKLTYGSQSQAVNLADVANQITFMS